MFMFMFVLMLIIMYDSSHMNVFLFLYGSSFWHGSLQSVLFLQTIHMFMSMLLIGFDRNRINCYISRLDGTVFFLMDIVLLFVFLCIFRDSMYGTIIINDSFLYFLYGIICVCIIICSTSVGRHHGLLMIPHLRVCRLPIHILLILRRGCIFIFCSFFCVGIGIDIAFFRIAIGVGIAFSRISIRIAIHTRKLSHLHWSGVNVNVNVSCGCTRSTCNRGHIHHI
mmetsp:Transcript_5058/g.7420  ORF Transcript_5058/g.7420 Transcript_5058/m.7420 type:complete len:224 (+) Transcript_5058:234-905(+)